jgi:hypothetical protein
LFSSPRFRERIEMDNQSRTTEIKLAEHDEEYEALERSKIMIAQVAVRSHQAFLVNNSIRSTTPITDSKRKGTLALSTARAMQPSLEQAAPSHCTP